MGRGSSWVCPKLKMKLNSELICYCKRFRVFTPHQTDLNWNIFFKVSNISLKFQRFSSFTDQFFLLLASKPGALNLALGIESPLHSLPEFMTIVDLSWYLSLIDSSTCLLRGSLKVLVGTIVKLASLLPPWWTLLWITRQLDVVPAESPWRCSFPLEYRFLPDSPWLKVV